MAGLAPPPAAWPLPVFVRACAHFSIESWVQRAASAGSGTAEFSTLFLGTAPAPSKFGKSV